MTSVIRRSSPAGRRVAGRNAGVRQLRCCPFGQAWRRRRRLFRSGISTIWIALLGIVLIGMTGLGIDAGYAYLVAHQLQNAADAAALAGAAHVRGDPADARQAAMTIAQANEAARAAVLLTDNPENGADGDIVLGIYDRSAREFAPNAEAPNAVKVVARRTAGSLNGRLPLFFGPLFGLNEVDIARDAIAMIGGGTGAGLICLEEEEKWTFRLSGDVTLNVLDVTTEEGNGSIQINSEHGDAIKVDGITATLRAAEINVYADEADPPPPEVYDGETNTSRPRIPDPLAHLEPPPPGPDQGPAKITGGIHTLSPGYYPEGIEITGGDVTLTSGIYVVAGEGLKVTGGDLTAHEVMFYVLPGKKSNVVLTGNGIIDITPMPLEVEPYGGIAIWQSKENTNLSSLRGTDQFTGVGGTLYFPTAPLDLVGTSDNFDISQLIVDSLRISGRGAMTIHYDGRFPAPGGKVFLVK